MREPKEIQAEYANLCAQSGEKAFQILSLEKDVRRINARIRSLNVELNTVLQAQAAAAQAEADAKAAQEAKVVAEAVDEQPAITN
jgi:hypothetical protein